MSDRFLAPVRQAGHDWARETRILRDRNAAYTRALDRASSESSFKTARQFVQIYNGGSMPTVVDRVYFTHPVIVSGTEIEGGTATTSVDTATTVPVVVLGQVPSIGDMLVAFAVGGRWVAERGTGLGGAGIVCSPCTIPAENLTISWTNLLTGDGLGMLTYSRMPSPSWATSCVDNGVEFTLACTGGEIELRVYFFVSGICPTGETDYCSNLQESPLTLTLTDQTCSPFGLTFTVGESSCPTVYSLGNTTFVITL
jgi:hypothetical protein